MLAVLFARRDDRFHAHHIVGGQYLGFAVIVGGCLLAGAALRELSDPVVAALGLIPLALGVRGLIARDHHEGEPRPPVAGTFGVALVTLANGADDVAVYGPLFAAVGTTEIGVTAAVFAVLVAVWCAGGAYVGSHPAVIRTVDRLGDRAVPYVFIALGVYIVAAALG